MSADVTTLNKSTQKEEKKINETPQEEKRTQKETHEQQEERLRRKFAEEGMSADEIDLWIDDLINKEDGFGNVNTIFHLLVKKVSIALVAFLYSIGRDLKIHENQFHDCTISIGHLNR